MRRGGRTFVELHPVLSGLRLPARQRREPRPGASRRSRRAASGRPGPGLPRRGASSAPRPAEGGRPARSVPLARARATSSRIREGPFRGYLGVIVRREGHPAARRLRFDVAAERRRRAGEGIAAPAPAARATPRPERSRRAPATTRRSAKAARRRCTSRDEPSPSLRRRARDRPRGRGRPPSSPTSFLGSAFAPARRRFGRGGFPKPSIRSGLPASGFSSRSTPCRSASSHLTLAQDAAKRPADVQATLVRFLEVERRFAPYAKAAFRRSRAGSSRRFSSRACRETTLLRFRRWPLSSTRKSRRSRGCPLAERLKALEAAAKREPTAMKWPVALIQARTELRQWRKALEGMTKLPADAWMSIRSSSPTSSSARSRPGTGVEPRRRSRGFRRPLGGPTSQKAARRTRGASADGARRRDAGEPGRASGDPSPGHARGRAPRRVLGAASRSAPRRREPRRSTSSRRARRSTAPSRTPASASDPCGSPRRSRSGKRRTTTTSSGPRTTRRATSA